MTYQVVVRFAASLLISCLLLFGCAPGTFNWLDEDGCVSLKDLPPDHWSLDPYLPFVPDYEVCAGPA